VRKTNIFTTHTRCRRQRHVSHLAGRQVFWTHFLRAAPHPRTIYQSGCTLKPGRYVQYAVLALRFSDHRNAVSEIHGQVARRMWNFLWPDRKEEDVPITSITNACMLSGWRGACACSSNATWEPTGCITWTTGNVNRWKISRQRPVGYPAHLKRKLAILPTSALANSG